jgi:hypothetical protein
MITCINCGTNSTTKWYLKKTLCRICYTKSRSHLPQVKANNKRNAQKVAKSEKRKDYLKKYGQRIDIKQINVLNGRKFRNSEHGKEWGRNYNKTPTARFAAGRKRAKVKNYIWDISKEDYVTIISNSCYYCCKSLSEEKGVSLDRIDNNLGYLLTNVLPCCGICNKTRSNIFTVDETKVMITALLDYRKDKK